MSYVMLTFNAASYHTNVTYRNINTEIQNVTSNHIVMLSMYLYQRKGIKNMDDSKNIKALAAHRCKSKSNNPFLYKCVTVCLLDIPTAVQYSNATACFRAGQG